MKQISKFKYRALRSYLSSCHNSTNFHKGEKVIIQHNHDGMPELKKWIKCVGENNNIGWIPREYIYIIQNRMKDFSKFSLHVNNIHKMIYGACSNIFKKKF